MPSKLSILIAASLVGGIVLLTGIAWLLRKKTFRKSDFPSAGPSPGSTSPTPPTPRLEPIPPEKESQVSILSPSRSQTKLEAPDLAEFVLKVPDHDLRIFLQEIAARIQEEGPDFDKETSVSFIEEMVDRVDDLASMARNHDGQAAIDLVSFRDVIITILSVAGAELIQSDIWDPSQQRAIAKEATSGLEAPIILRFGSTGICRHGQLVRKQEVVLAVPESITQPTP